MSYVNRFNRSLKGLGCSCNCGDDPTFGSSNAGMRGLADLVAASFPIPMNPIQKASALAGLGMDTYSSMSWHPPSQSSQDGYFGNGGGSMAVTVPGTAAHGLAAVTPDPPTPLATAVSDALSNDFGSAQPGVLPLYPNATADGLSFVKTPPPSLQCQLVSQINANPLWFLLAVAGVFYVANMGDSKARRARGEK